MISPRVLLTANNLHPKKQFGQNFLVDQSFAEMIVARSEISPKDVILEIGSGLGALTIPLARMAEKVYAVERDPEILKILKVQILAGRLSNVVFMQEDILRVDMKKIAQEAGRNIVVMGNLPYNISSQILVQLIDSKNNVSKAILMFQKELAERITAPPNCKAYGRLTVMLRYCADITKVAGAKASLFYPKPKVDSEVLEVRFHGKLKHPAKNEGFFFKVIKAAFGQRRKTLKNALSGSALKIDAKDALNVLQRAGIDPVRRAETLSVEEFVRLSNCF